MKYVSPLTDGEISVLNDIRKNDLCPRVRDRAHCILLSGRGYKIDEIADISGADRRTVSSLIDAWENYGCGGLSDSPRSGRPRKLTDDEREKAAELIRKNPRSSKTVIQNLHEATGKIVSIGTMKRIAKGAGLRWKRVRKSVRRKRDEGEFRKAEEEIAELRRQEKNGGKAVYFCDEAGFDLQPSVPYAWQPEGEIIEIPASRSSRLSAAGFLSTADCEFHCFVFECPVTADIAAACADSFRKLTDGDAAVVIDNAPVHTGSAFTENIEKWEREGLTMKYLPPYPPELNLIEILWRSVKYVRMPFSAYISFENPVKEVENILRGIGSEYRINFFLPDASG